MRNKGKLKLNALETSDCLCEKTIQIDKRTLLKWLPPVVSAIALPAHAQTSVSPPLPDECTSALIALALAPSKCSGPANALVGQATIMLTSDSDPIEITSITHDAPSSDTIALPALPATATSTNGVDIAWQGPGSDSINCLPLTTITITIAYNCGVNTTEIEIDVNVTEVLAAAIS